jgi:flagellar protein FlaG
MSAAIGNAVTPAVVVTGDMPASRAAATPAFPVAAASQQAPAPLAPVERGVEFHVDDSTGLTVVSVIDRKTGELIRQIPEEVEMRIARYIEAELGASGVVDTSA